MQRLLGDLPAPGRRHRRVADGLLARLAVGALGLERVEQRGAQLLRSRRWSASPSGSAPSPSRRCRRRPPIRASLPSVLLKTSSTCWVLTVPFCAGGRHRHLGAALEVDAEGEAAQQDARDRDRDDQAADRVPQLAAADDLERAGAGVEPDEEAVLAALRPACLRGRAPRRRRIRSRRMMCFSHRTIPVPSHARRLVARARSAAPRRDR